MNRFLWPIYFAAVLYFFFSRTPSSEVSARNPAKLCYVFGRKPDLKMGVQILGVPSLLKRWTKKPAYILVVYDAIVTYAQYLRKETSY